MNHQPPAAVVHPVNLGPRSVAGGACDRSGNRPSLRSESLLSRGAEADPCGDPTQPSPAERRVLSLLLAGLSNKEIAASLGRAEPTIKHQVSACLRKFGQPSRARLIAALR
mgnify:CR=1 FL=1